MGFNSSFEKRSKRVHPSLEKGLNVEGIKKSQSNPIDSRLYSAQLQSLVTQQP